MSTSASNREGKRQETARRLRRCALELTRDRGFDGWTMDDLAGAAEVSRRTVFNYFEAKADVVLGPRHDPDEDELGVFLTGGPTGRLFDDLVHLVTEAVADKAIDLELERMLRGVIHEDPRLVAIVHERFREIGDQFVDLLLEREGRDFGVRRAHLALGLLITIFTSVLHDADPASEQAFPDLVADSVADVRSLLALD